jgi:hypothetical protein
MLLVAAAAMLFGGLVLWHRRPDPTQPALPPPWILEHQDPFIVSTRMEIYVNGEDLRTGTSPPRRVFLHYSPQVPGDRARSASRLLVELQHEQVSHVAPLPSGHGRP